MLEDPEYFASTPFCNDEIKERRMIIMSTVVAFVGNMKLK